MPTYRSGLMLLLLTATAVLGSSPGIASARAPSYFQSPSGNIGCGISTGGARCDIAEHDWKAPPKPKSCKFDWGYGLTLGVHGKGDFFCGSDSLLGIGPVLDYGDSITRGRFKCTASTAGIRCANSHSTHGFKLSRAHAKRF